MLTIRQPHIAQLLLLLTLVTQLAFGSAHGAAPVAVVKSEQGAPTVKCHGDMLKEHHGNSAPSALSETGASCCDTQGECLMMGCLAGNAVTCSPLILPFKPLPTLNCFQHLPSPRSRGAALFRPPILG